MPTPIRLHGTKGRVDRTGVITIDAVYFADRLSDVLEFLGQPDEIEGLPRTDADFSQDAAGQYVITAVYEGLTPSASADPGADERFTEFILDGNDEKVRIETHRLFEQLKERFGWDEENKMFPATAPTSGGTTGLSKSTEAPGESELAGVDSYYEAGGNYTIRYSARLIPADLLRGVGSIVQTPRGIERFNIPNPGGKRNWRKKFPRIVKRGNAVQIEERYEMSGPRGWSNAIYGEGQLETGLDA